MPTLLIGHPGTFTASPTQLFHLSPTSACFSEPASTPFPHLCPLCPGHHSAPVSSPRWALPWPPHLLQHSAFSGPGHRTGRQGPWTVSELTVWARPAPSPEGERPSGRMSLFTFAASQLGTPRGTQERHKNLLLNAKHSQVGGATTQNKTLLDKLPRCGESNCLNL